MAKREVTYEVLVRAEERWIIDSVHSAQEAALARGQALLATNQHDAVKVLREAGAKDEDIVFQQECTSKAEKPITISSIEDAAICAELDDFTNFSARKTTGRLLRAYLNEKAITALELLHRYDHLRELQRSDRLFNQAIQKVSAVQARALEENAQDRAEILYRLTAQLTDRVRDAAKTDPYLEIVNNDGLTAALCAIDDAVAPDARRFLVHAVLADFARQEAEWDRKLDLVFDQLDKQPDAEARSMLDELCAEIMDGSKAVQDILGQQPNLATALRIMAQISRGRELWDIEDERLIRFSKIMNQHEMPTTQDILLERIARALMSTNPLTRENASADQAVLPKLVRDLCAFGGLLGGPEICQAVTRRARSVMTLTDRDLSPEEGLDSIIEMLPSNAVRVGYLLDLARSEFGATHQALTLSKLLHILQPLDSLTDLAPADSSNQYLSLTVADLQSRIGDDVLGAEIGNLISKKLERLLDINAIETKLEPEPAAQIPKVHKPPKLKPEQKCNIKTYQAGDIIFREDDSGDEAFMILSGEVKISTISSDREIVIASLGRGEIFGEMALVDDETRMATATATKLTELSVVPQEAFKKRLSKLAEEDRLISHMMEVLVQRLRQSASSLHSHSIGS